MNKIGEQAAVTRTKKNALFRELTLGIHKVMVVVQRRILGRVVGLVGVAGLVSVVVVADGGGLGVLVRHGLLKDLRFLHFRW